MSMVHADHLEYLRRARGYRLLDARLCTRTRFFGAAALMCEVFAALCVSPARFTVSTAARGFLARLSAELEAVNHRIAQGLARHPHAAQASLDARMVRIEQYYVQRRLENLCERSRPAGERVVVHCNRLLNPPRRGCGRGDAAAERFAAVLDALRRREARPLDFARQADREAIGVSLIEAVRDGALP